MISVRRAPSPDDDVRALVGALDEELGSLCPPEQRHGLKLDEIFAPHIRFFLAYQNEDSIACGGVALFSAFAEVKRMYVRPHARGGGAADAIMARLIGEASGAGLGVMRLETGADFIAANRFYRRWGFQPCAIFEPYASKPPHSVAASAFLEKRL